jgi:hypothetical protein
MGSRRVIVGFASCKREQNLLLFRAKGKILFFSSLERAGPANPALNYLTSNLRSAVLKSAG